METLYFTLGIASVVVTAVAVVAVWAMFKVAKMNSMFRDIEQQFTNTHRDITMVQQTMMNQLDHRANDIDKRFDDLNRELENVNQCIGLNTDELYRHIDSRVDKLAAKQEKQLING